MNNKKYYRGGLIKDISNKSDIDFESTNVRPRFNYVNLSLNKLLVLTGNPPKVEKSIYIGVCQENNELHLGNQYSLEEFLLYFYNYPKGYQTEIELKLYHNPSLHLTISDIWADTKTLFIKIYKADFKDQCFTSVNHLKDLIKIPISSISQLTLPNNINWKV